MRDPWRRSGQSSGVAAANVKRALSGVATGISLATLTAGANLLADIAAGQATVVGALTVFRRVSGAAVAPAWE